MLKRSFEFDCASVMDIFSSCWWLGFLSIHSHIKQTQRLRAVGFYSFRNVWDQSNCCQTMTDQTLWSGILSIFTARDFMAGISVPIQPLKPIKGTSTEEAPWTIIIDSNGITNRFTQLQQLQSSLWKVKVANKQLWGLPFYVHGSLCVLSWTRPVAVAKVSITSWANHFDFSSLGMSKAKQLPAELRFDAK